MPTSYSSIRDDLSRRMVEATPSLLPELPFKACPPRYQLDVWSARVGSSAVRAFNYRRVATLDPPHLEAEVISRNETTTLSVAYPSLPGLYGTADLGELERVMRLDAAQLRDIITSQQTDYNTRATILAPVTRGPVWYQRLRVELSYLEARS